MSGRWRSMRTARRSSRRSRRGFADILAEVFVLTITLVVAVTLLGTIGRLQVGGATVAIGTNLVLGPALNDSGTYRLSVAYVGAPMQLSDLAFGLRTPAGLVPPAAGWSVVAYDLHAAVLGTYTPGAAWTGASGSAVTSGVSFGVLTPSQGVAQGAELVVAGQGSWSGTMIVSLNP